MFSHLAFGRLAIMLGGVAGERTAINVRSREPRRHSKKYRAAELGRLGNQQIYFTRNANIFIIIRLAILHAASASGHAMDVIMCNVLPDGHLAI